MLHPNVPAWFEIPAQDFERAVRFYEQVLEASLKRETMETRKAEMAVFPHVKPGASGAVVKGEGFSPSALGTIVYLSLDDLQPALSKVERAGGAVLLPRTELPGGMGAFAQIRDSEGNRVGLFSPA